MRQFTPRDFVFRQGDPVRSLHLVEEGEIRLVRHQIGGCALTLQRASAGAILAEASLFSERYHCDAVAVRATRTLALTKSALRDMLLRDAGFAEQWSGYLAREVQTARLRAETLALRTVAERLDAWIASNEGCLPIKGGWKSIATEIAVSPEALYRELARRRKASTGVHIDTALLEPSCRSTG